MSNKKFVNRGLQIGTQNNQGGEVNNAGRDINITKNMAGVSLQEFQDLLGQISSELRAAKLPSNDKKDIEASIETVVNQSQKKEPKKSLILGPLAIALELLTQASGAAKAIETIMPLLNKAISFAQHLFP